MKSIWDLKQAIEKDGQSKFAARLGVSQSYVSDLYNERTPITIYFAGILNDKLKIDPLPLLRWQLELDWEKHKARKKEKKARRKL